MFQNPYNKAMENLETVCDLCAPNDQPYIRVETLCVSHRADYEEAATPTIHEQIQNLDHIISSLLRVRSLLLTAAGGYHPEEALVQAKNQLSREAALLAKIAVQIGAL